MKDSGVYALIIRMNKNQRLKIGKLGNFKFSKGFYIYTGSALNGLAARINRHRRKQKKFFWHIDYLLNSKHSHISEVLTIRTSKRLECQLNRIISELPNAKIVAKKFGCLDCNCKTHLYYFSDLDLKRLLF